MHECTMNVAIVVAVGYGGNWFRKIVSAFVALHALVTQMGAVGFVPLRVWCAALNGFSRGSQSDHSSTLPSREPGGGHLF